MEKLIMNNGDSSKLMHLFLQILSHLTGKTLQIIARFLIVRKEQNLKRIKV
ncbi:hypothetical protein [Niallia taxi]|uniref:hypothetical protein n=1 Tax=Niallia taxi TaxID=2499688 RepID=UPI003D28AE22